MVHIQISPVVPVVFFRVVFLFIQRKRAYQGLGLALTCRGELDSGPDRNEDVHVERCVHWALLRASQGQPAGAAAHVPQRGARS